MPITERLIFRLARLPLRRRRPLFRAVWDVVGRRMPTFDQGLAPTFANVLRMPTRATAKLSRDADFLAALSLLEWSTFKTRSLPELIEDGRSVDVDGEETIRMLARDGRNVIFAPLHMGAYVFAMALMIQRHFQGRRVLILVNHADDAEMRATLGRIAEVGCEVRLMGVRDKAGYVDALRFARKDAVVICFVDLPATYGVPYETELFGRPARIGMGIDLLARATQAAVVPLAITSHLLSERIVVRPAFEVDDDGPAERRRVGEIVRRHIEATILDAPAQWHMWPRVGEYFPPAEELAA